MLRAIAILLVFNWHYHGKGGVSWLSWVSPYGWTGVDLFFVLSGFLIAGQLFKPLKTGGVPSLKRFYLKRSFRILPAYLVVVGLYFLIPAWNEGNGLPPLWKFLTFTQNFGLDRSQASGFSHAWSLCVEEHFYLTLPSLVFFVWWMRDQIKPKFFAFALPVTVFILGMALRAGLWFKFISPALADPNHKEFTNFFDEVIYYPSYNRLDGLLVGVVIALLFTFRPTFKERLERSPNLPAVIGLIFLGLAAWIISDRTSLVAVVFGFPAFSLGYGGLVMSAATPRSILNRIHIPGSAWMATLAFTLYLTHKELIHLFQPLFKSSGFFPNETMMLLGVFAASLAGALVLHLMIEQPFLNLRKRMESHGRK